MNYPITRNLELRRFLRTVLVNCRNIAISFIDPVVGRITGKERCSYMRKQGMPERRVPSPTLRRAQLPDEGVIGFQISHTIAGRFRDCSRRGQEKQMHGIVRGGLVSCKQRNHREQRPNFSTNPLHIMFFLTQNNMQILH
jgi:hypothetical protein